MKNLHTLLKGHEGETFYCTLCGNVTVEKITPTNYIIVDSFDNKNFCLESDGKFYSKGECVLFPSKDQRDWDIWNKSKTPKIWSDIKHCNAMQAISSLDPTEPILKSALALLKIHQLIEAGYGGVPTDDEWYTTSITTIECVAETDKYEPVVVCNSTTRLPIAFHTEKQAREFLSYPENVQLFNDFYML